jgi:hypothetical protein
MILWILFAKLFDLLPMGIVKRSANIIQIKSKPLEFGVPIKNSRLPIKTVQVIGDFPVGFMSFEAHNPLPLLIRLSADQSKYLWGNSNYVWDGATIKYDLRN